LKGVPVISANVGIDLKKEMEETGKNIPWAEEIRKFITGKIEKERMTVNAKKANDIFQGFIGSRGAPQGNWSGRIVTAILDASALVAYLLEEGIDGLNDILSESVESPGADIDGNAQCNLDGDAR
jgi:hypothetical protein